MVEGRGHRETLQCPYHAWTYDLDGSLRTAPRSDREHGVDAGALSLHPVLVDTWGPLVFVNPDLGAAPLGDTLGDLPPASPTPASTHRRSSSAVAAGSR